MRSLRHSTVPARSCNPDTCLAEPANQYPVALRVRDDRNDEIPNVLDPKSFFERQFVVPVHLCGNRQARPRFHLFVTLASLIHEPRRIGNGCRCW
jgi:hypothetical protein